MTNALEFLQETNRMCSSHKECTDCPLKCLASFYGYSTCRIAMFNECEKAVSAVDAWSKKHPIRTNAEKFKEVFGYEPKFFSGIYFCPVPSSQHCGENTDCCTCGKWWDKPYKEPQKK